MKIRLCTITHKTPAWIQAGYDEYARRLPPAYSLELIEVPAEKRSDSADLTRLTEREGEKLLAATKAGDRLIALDIKGSPWSTDELARQMQQWHHEGRNVNLLVGGPDGLSPACLAKADTKWSLSALTFPHFIVKLIVAEQIYRAYTILANHPYHR